MSNLLYCAKCRIYIPEEEICEHNCKSYTEERNKAFVSEEEE